MMNKMGFVPKSDRIKSLVHISGILPFFVPPLSDGNPAGLIPPLGGYPSSSLGPDLLCPSTSAVLTSPPPPFLLSSTYLPNPSVGVRVQRLQVNLTPHIHPSSCNPHLHLALTIYTSPPFLLFLSFRMLPVGLFRLTMTVTV